MSSEIRKNTAIVFALQLSSLTPQISSLTLQLSSLTLQLPSLTLQLSGLTPQISSLTLQLSRLTLQLPSLTLQLSGLTLQLAQPYNTDGAGNDERDPEEHSHRVCARFSSGASLRGGPRVHLFGLCIHLFDDLFDSMYICLRNVAFWR